MRCSSCEATTVRSRAICLAAASDGSDPWPGVAAARRAAARTIERYTYEDSDLVVAGRDERARCSAPRW